MVLDSFPPRRTSGEFPIFSMVHIRLGMWSVCLSAALARTESLRQTHIMANTTAIITQLVFEHALRIRVKAETGSSKAKDGAEPAGDKDKGKTANLQGKMTNLVTTDLAVRATLSFHI